MSWKRLLTDAIRGDRCRLCLDRSQTMASINSVQLCNGCFVLFNQTVEMPRTCFNGATDTAREHLLQSVEDTYKERKQEFLTRLESNVQEILSRERNLIEQDAKDARDELEHWYEVRDAEKRLAELKGKRKG